MKVQYLFEAVDVVMVVVMVERGKGKVTLEVKGEER